MRRTRIVAAAVAAVAALTVGVVVATAGNGGSTMSHAGHGMTVTSAKQISAADLRVTLDRLLGEHAVLAMNTTNLGVTGIPVRSSATRKTSVRHG